MSNRSTYRKLAKKHGVKPKEVKAEMQSALNLAYADPGNGVIQPIKTVCHGRAKLQR